ncbi:MAG: peptidase and DD-carboxypeptidase VanY/endolysin [Ilumatobacteraceae bacterium]|nr:peptidase and DD-carboxypeptidase VanY/endolysin [Ilumatobacteraceae bacterium]
MTPSKPARTATRRSRVATTVVVVAAVVGLIALVSSRRSGPAPDLAARSMRTTSAFASDPAAPAHLADPSGPVHPSPPPQAAEDGAIGEDDGVLPDGVTVFRDDVAGVADLDPALLAALRAAATDAAGDGVEFTVHSGWRSRAYQEDLLREAVVKYASEEEAARWVAPPDRSAHVSGDAIDLESGAARWLARHGAAYGLCQVYDNEDWHYELRPDAARDGCPDRYADAAHDPRMQP